MMPRLSKKSLNSVARRVLNGKAQEAQKDLGMGEELLSLRICFSAFCFQPMPAI
jgi:hypothetical protein